MRIHWWQSVRNPMLVRSRARSRRRVKANFVCAEVVGLFTLCTLDTWSSAWLFAHHLAEEANPILRGAAEAGVAPFVLLKLASFVPALVAAEWYRRRRPAVALPLLRFVTVSYVAIYGIGVAGQMVFR